MSLVEIIPPVFDVDLSIAYATAENFTGQAVYSRPGSYLHADAAALLQRAIDLARPHGLRFKVFDTFRPAEAQWALWAQRVHGLLRYTHIHTHTHTHAHAHAHSLSLTPVAALRPAAARVRCRRDRRTCRGGWRGP